jgi:cell fate (sporulation/competence/biofilm development) regulator YlbF (YheA/YmcA/DUF963 family)
MPVDTQQILDEAEKLAKLVAQHPAVERYRQAQQAVAQDPDAGRLLADFDKTLEHLARQEQEGSPVTDAQRDQLEHLQRRIISHIQIKNLNMAQVDFIDLLRRINQTIQRPLFEGAGRAPTAAAVPGAGGPRLGAGN